MDESILRMNGANIEGALEYSGDMDMYNDIIKEFIPEANSNLENLKKCLEEKDMPNYAIYAHSLKASARYLGFTSLFDIAYKHEMDSKANDINSVLASYSDLVMETNKWISIVNQYLGN